MKKTILALLLLSNLTGYTQTEKIDITIKEEKDPMEGFDELMAEKREELRELQKEVGVKYLGDGEYKMIKIYKNGFIKRKKIEKKVEKDVAIFSKNKKANNYNIINQELNRSGLDWWRADVVFHLLDANGGLLLNKEDARVDKKNAKQELLDLKELLDMGIISQNEFNEKAAKLKKILLSN